MSTPRALFFQRGTLNVGRWTFCLVLIALATTRCAWAATDPAAALFARAEGDVLRGEQDEAIRTFESIIRRHKESDFAPRAQLKIAQLYANNRQHADAFEAAQQVIEKFPASDLFSEALETQFTVVERVMEDYRKRRLKGDKSSRGLPKRETAREMLETMLASGRYSPHAPRVHYRLALALDDDDKPAEAIREFNLFVANYPSHPLADDAAFQIAFIDYRTAREPNRDRGARERARLAFEDFLARYGESEKGPEARHLLATLRTWETDKLGESGQYYERTGQVEAARLTYGEALRNDPRAPSAEAIQQRLDQVRGALGEVRPTGIKPRSWAGDQ